MTNKQLKVSVIEPVGGHGGMDYYDFGLCAGISSTGVDVSLYTCDKTITPSNAPFNVIRNYKNIYGNDKAWKRGLRYLKGSIKSIAIARKESRICHFHFFHVGTLQIIDFLLAKILGLRTVITAHDVESFVENLESPFLSRWVYHNCNMVIAHNKTSLQELTTRIGLPESRIRVIPHGNYLHALRNLPDQKIARAALNIPNKSNVILFFGQIKNVKGLDLLIDSMPLVLQKHPNTLLLIAGKPWKSDFSVYQSQIERLNIQDNCMLHIRYIADEDVPLYYSAADIVTLPYRRIYQSGVVLMAMSYGKAVLVSDLPGMLEIVKDLVNGYVFKQGDTKCLAEKLDHAITNEAQRSRISYQGYLHVRDFYDWNEIGILTRRLYETII